MTPKKMDVAKKVEEDHVCLNAEMGELQRTLGQQVAGEEFADWRLEFIWQLRDFKNRLLKHFDLEEEGGFMQEVLRVTPQEHNNVKKLKTEHDSIAANVDMMIADLRSMYERDTDKLQDIRSSLDSLMTTIKAHEAEEHRIMQRAYYREYGGRE